MSKNVLKGRDTINLNVLYVFNNLRKRMITTDVNFYSEGNFQLLSRQLKLTLSNSIRQAKQSVKSKKTDLLEE